jgi:acetyltransferase-like isoleucine patch superfamily enzyme
MHRYGKNRVGKNSRLFDPITLGFPSRDNIGKDDFQGTIIGDNALIRSGAILYSDVTIGDDFSSGHNILIREKTTIGDRVTVGSYAIIEGNTTLGNEVRIQSMVFVPTHTTIGNHVFIGPHTVLTNDKYPPTGKPKLKGPVIGDYAVIGANTTLLPGITVGKGALIAAGALVTHDIPDNFMAIGVPAKIRDLPVALKGHEKTG